MWGNRIVSYRILSYRIVSYRILSVEHLPSNRISINNICCFIFNFLLSEGCCMMVNIYVLFLSIAFHIFWTHVELWNDMKVNSEVKGVEDSLRQLKSESVDCRSRLRDVEDQLGARRNELNELDRRICERRAETDKIAMSRDRVRCSCYTKSAAFPTRGTCS